MMHVHGVGVLVVGSMVVINLGSSEKGGDEEVTVLSQGCNVSL